MGKSQNKERATFGSKLGVIFASVGSAVGLGNIWRFPYETGQQGGAAFILVYLICVLILGIPLVMAEFYLGRRSHANPVGAFRGLAPNTKWYLVGLMGVFSGVMIMGFYSVVSGWTFDYIFQALTGSLSDKTPEVFQKDFTAFSTNIYKPIIWVVIFMIITHVVIISGVKKGIERSAKIMMPMLFLIIVIMCIRSVTLPGGEKGLQFLFHPDFSKINSNVILGAMGQAFFSLSLGMGCLITYSSYFGPNVNLGKTAVTVALLDTMVAILAGVMIFPAVFSFGISPTQGPELVFITLPNVFQSMSFGYLWALLFFLLLGIAALTSAISLHEVTTSYMIEEYGLTRSAATSFVTITLIILGMICSLSVGAWSKFTIAGMNIFNLFDFISAKILLPLGGLWISIFVGWIVPYNDLKSELTNKGTLKFYGFNFYRFILRYFAPIAIILIFFNELGLISLS
ncbi:MAG: sodium-dependent transporter [Bacteroidales bacterium]|nr:sodium-dependent transporter [Bacteroidales bacterium]